MDRCEVQSSSDPICSFDSNELSSLLAKHIKCWSWKPVTRHNKSKKLHAHPSSWSKLSKLHFNRPKTKALDLTGNLGASWNPIQWKQAYGDLWAVDLFWLRMNEKSCWESDNLFQDPHFKWSAFTPKTGGKALKIRVVAHRLQSYLPLPSFLLSAIISYSFHLFVFWIPELLFGSLLLPPPDMVCSSSSALLIALPTTNPLNSEYIPHK